VEHSNSPSVQHSNSPSVQHSNSPSVEHSNTPSVEHSDTPSVEHSDTPSINPTNHPSAKPTLSPTAEPTNSPTSKPSNNPSAFGDDREGDPGGLPDDDVPTNPDDDDTPTLVTDAVGYNATEHIFMMAASNEEPNNLWWYTNSVWISKTTVLTVNTITYGNGTFIQTNFTTITEVIHGNLYSNTNITVTLVVDPPVTNSIGETTQVHTTTTDLFKVIYNPSNGPQVSNESDTKVEVKTVPTRRNLRPRRVLGSRGSTTLPNLNDHKNNNIDIHSPISDVTEQFEFTEQIQRNPNGEDVSN
jgi:hypothetical protein